METNRVTIEPPKPARVRLLRDGVSVGARVHSIGDVVDVPQKRADAMFRYNEAIYDDPAMKTPVYEGGRLLPEAGMLAPTDVRRMAGEIAALKEAVAELREVIATVAASASRPKSSSK